MLFLARDKYLSHGKKGSAKVMHVLYRRNYHVAIELYWSNLLTILIPISRWLFLTLCKRLKGIFSLPFVLVFNVWSMVNGTIEVILNILTVYLIMRIFKFSKHCIVTLFRWRKRSSLVSVPVPSLVLSSPFPSWSIPFLCYMFETPPDALPVHRPVFKTMKNCIFYFFGQ